MPKIRHHPISRNAREALVLLGNSIRAARIERAWTMDDVAERVGISRALLRRIESGDPGCAIGAVFEVAVVVGVPLFEPDPRRLALEGARLREKLSLLPEVVRPRRAAVVKDDF